MRTRLLFRSLGFGLGVTLWLFQQGAMADPIAYAERGFDYVRIDFGAGTTETVGPLQQLMSVGAFADNDFSKEYAIDYPAGDLYSIDTGTAAVTRIGSTGIGDIVSAMQWDPANNAMDLIAQDAQCSFVTLYILDIGTGATQQIGVGQGCLTGLAFDADDNAFSIDIAADTLVENGGTIGPLGFDVGYVSAFFFDARGQLNLIAEDSSVKPPSVSLYIVDTITGAAAFVAPYGHEYSAFALVTGSASDTVFSDGFDG